jgi:uncharacterized membrane protein
VRKKKEKAKSPVVEEKIPDNKSSFIHKLKWGNFGNVNKDSKSLATKKKKQQKSKSLTHSNNKINRREKAIDYMRGFSVLLMIITHVIALTFDHLDTSSRVAYNIGLVGGTISFTSFLLLSGISLRLSFEKYGTQDLTKFRKKLLVRALQVLIVYYVMAIVSFKVNNNGFSVPIDTQWLKNLIAILVFYRVPEFTEFLIPIIGFYVLFILFTKLFIYINKRFIFVVITSLISYALGYLLYQIDFNNKFLIAGKALLSGHEDLHTFPLFQYLPIFLVGMWIGNVLLKSANLKERSEIFAYLIIALTLVFAIFTQLYQQFEWGVFHFSPYASRFPPSLGFIVLSLNTSISFLLIFVLIENFILKIGKDMLQSLNFISINALDFLLIHTLFLSIFKYANQRFNTDKSWRYSNLQEILTIYLLTLLVCFVYIILKNLIKRFCSKEAGTYWLLTLRFMLIVLVLNFIGLFAVNYVNSAVNTEEKNLTIGTDLRKELNIQDDSDLWWDYNYKFRQRIELDISNSAEVARIVIDHKKLLEETKLSGQNGEDIKIVAQRDSDNLFQEKAVIFENLKMEDLKIFFQPLKDATISHYIYYGNPSQTVSTPGFDFNPEAQEVIPGNINTTEESNIVINTNRKWFLKGIDTTLELNVGINQMGGEILSAYYNISGLQSSNSELTKVADNAFTGKLDLIDFQPGKYDLEVTLITLADNIEVYTSRKIPIYISYPLYVSWTIDWEGWDVSDAELNDIAGISDKYKMPITHFFNPRIYIKSQYTMWGVSTQRADYLTNWVKGRRANNGDEIGLHLHLYEDFLKEIGITPKEDQKIIGIDRNETLLSAYSLEDLNKIFSWSIDMFAAKGLGQPVSFRSGAWISSVDVLQAAYNAGIKVDSSGRTGGKLNPANDKSTLIPWSLGIKTKPYLPSYASINAWYGQRIGIWEFPNNGADSYWFSLDMLKARFDENYLDKNNVLPEAQSVVYLSHPHGFTAIDSVKIRGLLDYMGKYKFSNDEGPVIYSTLEQTYNRWDKSLINGD